jgi:hypothetical protein
MRRRVAAGLRPLTSVSAAPVTVETVTERVDFADLINPANWNITNKDSIKGVAEASSDSTYENHSFTAGGTFGATAVFSAVSGQLSGDLLLRVRAKVSTTTGAPKVRASLYEGTVLKSTGTWQNLTTSFATYTWTYSSNLLSDKTGAQARFVFEFSDSASAPNVGYYTVSAVDLIRTRTSQTVSAGPQNPATYPTASRSILVSNSQELQAALQAVQPGEHIVLSSGSYSGQFSAFKHGTKESPIVIRGEQLHTAEFTGSLELRGNHTWIYGVQFNAATLRLIGEGTVASRCYWRQGQDDISAACVSVTGVDCQVGFCEFDRYRAKAVEVLPGAGARRTWIHRNYFHDSNTDQRYQLYGIVIGSPSDELVELGGVVEYNLFRRCLSKQNNLILNFCSRVSINNNTIEQCYGALINNRAGNGNSIKGNWISDPQSGVGGINNYGADNAIHGNFCSGKISIYAGNRSPLTIDARDTPASLRASVVSNIATVIVGATPPSDVPATDTVVEANQGTVQRQREVGTTVSATSSISVPAPVRLVDTDVGPYANMSGGLNRPPAEPSGARIVNVTNSTELTNALQNAQVGDKIVLANGTYSGNYTVNVAQVALVAASINGASITGVLSLQGMYQQVYGVRFSGGGRVEVSNVGQKVVRCRFDGCTSSPVIKVSKEDCEISWCEFVGLQAQGVNVRPADGGRRAWIHHNYFYNSTSSGTDRHAILLGVAGTDISLQAACVVEFNLFENVTTHDQVIQVLSSTNILRYNTFVNCGTSRYVQIQYGVNNALLANYFDQSGGWRIMDRDNSAVGNKCLGGQFQVSAGTHDPDTSPGWQTPPLDYPAAKRSVVAGNDGALLVGHVFPGRSGDQTVPANATEVSGHVGTITYGTHSGTTTPSLNRTVPAAVRLTSADVGQQAGQLPTTTPSGWPAGWTVPSLKSYHGIGQAFNYWGGLYVFQRYDQWLGRPTNVATVWAEQNVPDWDSLAGGAGPDDTTWSGQINMWNITKALDTSLWPADRPVIICITGLPATHAVRLSNNQWQNANSWQRVANGEFDVYYTRLFRRLAYRCQQAGKPANKVIIRFAWEMNGTWYNHAVGSDKAGFIAAWQRIVTLGNAAVAAIMGSGKRFLWEFGPSYQLRFGNRTSERLWNIYPGDAYVDIVSLSLHDNIGIKSSADWQRLLEYDKNNQLEGLHPWFDFARSRGKPVGISEMSFNHTAKQYFPVTENPEAAWAGFETLRQRYIDAFLYFVYLSDSYTSMFDRGSWGEPYRQRYKPGGVAP